MMKKNGTEGVRHAVVILEDPAYWRRLDREMQKLKVTKRGGVPGGCVYLVDIPIPNLEAFENGVMKINGKLRLCRTIRDVRDLLRAHEELEPNAELMRSWVMLPLDSPPPALAPAI